MEYNIYKSIEEILLNDKNIDPKKDIYDLWITCFGDSTSFTDFYFKWVVGKNQIYTVYQGNKLCSMLHLNPYVLNLKGSKVLANYIVGVATSKAYRRQGLMKVLLEKALNQMYNDKMPFTYLMPAKDEYYLPFGFRRVYEQEDWKQHILDARIKDRNGKRPTPIDYKAFPIACNDTKIMEKLSYFTNECLSQYYDVFVHRNVDYFKKLIDEMHSSNGEVMVVLEKNHILGFIAYMKENGLQIAEAVYSLDKKEAFWYIIANQLGSFVQEEKREFIPTIMTRIVNWHNFVKDITSSYNMNLVMKVRDGIISGNNGIFEISFSKDGSNCSLSDKEPDLDGDIADYTSLFFGQFTKEDIGAHFKVKDIDIIYEKLNKMNYYKGLFINDVV